MNLAIKELCKWSINMFDRWFYYILYILTISYIYCVYESSEYDLEI